VEGWTDGPPGSTGSDGAKRLRERHGACLRADREGFDQVRRHSILRRTNQGTIRELILSNRSGHSH
jgi:hypothetical protein